MKLVLKITIFLIGGLGLLTSAWANMGVNFSSGQGVLDIKPYRLALAWDFGPVWHKESLWGMHLVWESSFAWWEGPPRPGLAADRARALKAATTGPLLRWQRQNPFAFSRIAPYAEIGVGLSWLSQTEIQGRILSLHFQFEDKAGIGMRFGKKQQYDVSLRAYHYSNASIKRPNSGVNLAMMSFGIWFDK